MLRITTSLVFLALLSSGARANDFKVDCKMCEGDPKGDPAAGAFQTLSSPALVTKSGQSASVFVGHYERIGGKAFPVGNELEVKTTRTADGAIQVTAILRIHSKTGGDAPQASTASKEKTAILQPGGGTMRIEISRGMKDSVWADLTIRPAK